MRAAISGRLLLALAFAATAGCGIAMRQVPFEASAADWEALAGDWRGDYTIADSDRHGSIMFRLKAGSREAAGDVLMIADRATGPYRPAPDPQRRPQAHDETQLLTIRFVAVDRGRVRGSMDPYWDPDRRCQARASFMGSIKGDVIAGPFSSVCEDGLRPYQGTWRVERHATTGLR